MARCLAESLVECNGFDATDQMERYVRWYKDGHLSSTGTAFGYGATTKRALDRFLTWETPYLGETDDNSASNGSLVRIAPIPMFFRTQPEATLKFARDSSRTTHGNIVVLEACQYVTVLMIKALNGADKKEVLFGDPSDYTAFVGRTSLVDFARGLRSAWYRRSEHEMEPGTYVLDTLSCALWALNESSSFNQGRLMAVNLGGDADSVGAVYGQLAGTIFGVGGISEGLKRKTYKHDVIVDVSHEMLKTSGLYDLWNQRLDGDANFR